MVFNRSDQGLTCTSIKNDLKLWVLRRAYNWRNHHKRKIKVSSSKQSDDTTDNDSRSTTAPEAHAAHDSETEPRSKRRRACANPRSSTPTYISRTAKVTPVASSPLDCTLATMASTVHSEDPQPQADHGEVPSEDLAIENFPFSSKPGAASSQELEPEKEHVLQEIAFDELFDVLQQPKPQSNKFDELDKHIHKLYSDAIHARMLAAIGGPRLRKGIAAMRLWTKMHSKLRDFQSSTGYDGKAADWDAHKQSLKSRSWKDAYMPALTAYRKLGLFVREMRERREWVVGADGFAADLADFYGSLLEAPGVKPEDLVDGFKEYNVELLAWFEA